jgi:hypothetical protein
MRVLLVVLEGATSGIVSPLIDRGELPHLSGVVERGCVGSLKAHSPLVRSMVWTTLATGQQPRAHGVFGDIAVRPDGTGVQRTGHGAWRARALWEFLTAAGHPCAIVGWPASAPATSWASGFIVDDTFADPLGPGFDAWTLLPDCVSPREWRNGLRELRVHPGDITGEQIVGLVPEAKKVDQDNDPRLTRVAVALARSSTIHAAATRIIKEYPWDFMAVSYPLLADLQREFLRYRLPELPGVDASDREVFGSVIDVAYRVQDAMVRTLLKTVDPTTTILIVSPYGFAAGDDRPQGQASKALPPSVAWHRQSGLFMAAGPGISADVLVHGARIEDIAPTVLALFGVRAAEQDGRCIDGLAKAGELREVSVTPPQAEPAPPEPIDVDTAHRTTIEQARIAWLANAAESHLGFGEYREAAENYEQLVERLPNDWLAKARLARCSLHLNDLERCRRLASEIVQSHPDLPWGYLLAAAGLVLGGEGHKAMDLLARAEEKGRDLPNLSLKLGVLHLIAQDFTKAEALFRDSLDSGPPSVEAYDGLGCALLAQRRYEAAVDAFKNGIGCFFHYPLAHLHLAFGLAELGRWDEAAESVATATSQHPGLPGVGGLIERIRQHLPNERAGNPATNSPS